MKTKKVLKQCGFIQLVEMETPIYGGKYAVINGDRAKTGLCFEAAKEVFNILKKLSR